MVVYVSWELSGTRCIPFSSIYPENTFAELFVQIEAETCPKVHTDLHTVWFGGFDITSLDEFSPDKTLSWIGINNHATIFLKRKELPPEPAVDKEAIVGFLVEVSKSGELGIIQRFINKTKRFRIQLIAGGISKAHRGELEILCKDDYSSAAKAISEADCLVVFTGAGWSKDSGLPTYPGVADIPAYHAMKKTYFDLCQPHWISSNPSIFFGFWGDCTNLYRETAPHKGYNIIKKWRDRIVDSSRMNSLLAASQLELNEDYNGPWARPSRHILEEGISKSSFYSLTSNVDAHWWCKESGGIFEKREVTEIHGGVERWICADALNCDHESFLLPRNFRFDVDRKTMLGSEPYPRCELCGGLARPQILMFGDEDYEDPGDGAKYDMWSIEIVRICSAHEGMKVVALEIGAGLRVPTIHQEVNEFAQSLRETKTELTVIRVNPDGQCIEDDPCEGSNQKFLAFQEGGLKTLKRIDALI